MNSLKSLEELRNLTSNGIELRISYIPKRYPLGGMEYSVSFRSSDYFITCPVLIDKDDEKDGDTIESRIKNLVLYIARGKKYSLSKEGRDFKAEIHNSE